MTETAESVKQEQSLTPTAFNNEETYYLTQLKEPPEPESGTTSSRVPASRAASEMQTFLSLLCGP